MRSPDHPRLSLLKESLIYEKWVGDFFFGSNLNCKLSFYRRLLYLTVFKAMSVILNWFLFYFSPFFILMVCLNFRTAKFNSIVVSVSLIDKSSSNNPEMISPLFHRHVVKSRILISPAANLLE